MLELYQVSRTRQLKHAIFTLGDPCVVLKFVSYYGQKFLVVEEMVVSQAIGEGPAQLLINTKPALANSGE